MPTGKGRIVKTGGAKVKTTKKKATIRSGEKLLGKGMAGKAAKILGTGKGSRHSKIMDL